MSRGSVKGENPTSGEWEGASRLFSRRLGVETSETVIMLTPLGTSTSLHAPTTVKVDVSTIVTARFRTVISTYH